MARVMVRVMARVMARVMKWDVHVQCNQHFQSGMFEICIVRVMARVIARVTARVMNTAHLRPWHHTAARLLGAGLIVSSQSSC